MPNFDFPSQRKNWSAPRGFRSYLASKNCKCKSCLDSAYIDEFWPRVSEKKQVDFFDVFFVLFSLFFVGLAFSLGTLLLELYLTSLGI